MKRPLNNNNNNNNDTDDESVQYSSKVLQTLTDTKLWKKLSVQANDVLESVSIWVSNKVEQDVKVLAALGLFAWDRVQQDVARALPATSSSSSGKSNSLPQQLLLLTNTSAYDTNVQSSSVREQLNRPQDEIKSVSRELFAILSGERTKYSKGRKGSSSPQQQQQQQQQLQRGLRTVAPAGTAFSGERQRRALQQKRKIEQSKTNIATNIGTNVVDSVWELRQEMKSEVNVPGYKTEPIRNAIAASVSATNNLLQGVRDRAQLVAAATIRQKNELLLEEQQQQQQQQQFEQESLDVNDNAMATSESWIEMDDTIRINDAVITQPEPDEIMVDVNDDDIPISALEFSLFQAIHTERERIMNQLTTCIDVPTTSWLTPELVDTFDSLEDITSPGIQNSITKMILLRDEIYKNHFVSSEKDHDSTSTTTTAAADTDTTTTIIPRSSFDAAVNDILAIRTAIDYLYNCTVQDVSELVAEEIRYSILFASSDTIDSNSNEKDVENVPLILRVEEELLNIEQQQQLNEEEIVIDSKNVFVMPTDMDPVRNTATSRSAAATAVVVPDVLDVIPDAVLMDVVPTTTRRMSDDNDYADMATMGYVAEIVTEDDFETAVGSTFKQVYNVNDDDDKEISESESSPNILLVIVLRSIDVVLFVTEKLLTVGIPGTITIVTNVVTRVDEMNRLGLGTKGWKELGNVAKAKGRY